jgi:hypothetical protein
VKQYDWGQHDVYKSNEGSGPLTARITHVSDGVVHLKIKHPRNNNEQAGKVKASLFFAEKTGWRLVEKEEAE